MSPDYYNEKDKVIYIAQYCSYQHPTLRYTIEAMLNAILLATGVILSWKSRSIVLPIHNEAKFVGFTIYNVAIFGAIGYITTFSTQKRPIANFGLTALFILIPSYVVMVLMLIPRVSIYLYNLIIKIDFIPA